jgi:hypothetical protein
MPKIRLEDIEDMEDFDMPKTERIVRQPKDEKVLPQREKTHRKYNPDAARRKEYVEKE